MQEGKKNLVADDIKTPEHKRWVLTVLSQTVAQTVIKTSSCGR
jgi:hypothetical protein